MLRMEAPLTLRAVTVAAVLAAAAGPGMAQYDRDGRYVPSPMGVPADPFARPIPLHPGTPGQAVGTPIWLRGAIPPPTPRAVLTPRVEPTVPPSNSRPIPL